jgi:hypothetical protein
VVVRSICSFGFEPSALQFEAHLTLRFQQVSELILAQARLQRDTQCSNQCGRAHGPFTHGHRTAKAQNSRALSGDSRLLSWMSLKKMIVNSDHDS